LNQYQPEQPVEMVVETPRKKSKWGSVFLEIFQTLIMALIFYFLIDSFFPRVRVENISMEPTLLPNELLLVNKLSYPGNPSEDYIKRLIGLPGDDIRIEDGLVFINNQPIDEPYISAPPAYKGTWKIPEDSFFVLGDNRNQSSDSHSWGFVPRENIVGKALIIYWPLDKVKTLYHPLVVNAAN
jgi:signal peptidase I